MQALRHGRVAPEPEVVYDSAARRAPVRGAIGDLYRYRALVALLVRRELTVRYKRSLLGVTWTIINPLLTSIVMWLVFSNLLRASIPGAPFIVYLLSGILVVTFFQQGVSMSAASVMSAAGMLTKVYVPPVVFGFSSACAGAINLLYGMVPLVALQIALGVGVAWTIVLVPIPLLFLLAMIAGIGFFLATFAIRFDDVLNIVNVFLLLIAYLTPTFYPITIVKAEYQKLFYLNPLYSYVSVFRYLCYGGPRPTVLSLCIIGLTGTVGLAGGLAVFARRWPSLAAHL